MAPKVYNASTSANTKTGRPSGVMSLATGTMSASETTNYRLRMYVDEDYNPQGDGGGLSFSVKINAYGKVKEAPTGSRMKAYTNDWRDTPQTDFHTDAYMSEITSIITKKDNIVPTTAIASWDISEAGDGSVMAYVEDDGSGNGTYKVTIGGKGGIIANESMIGYFADFGEMTSIDLSALDTSEVTNMSYMFWGCNSLTNLDVGKFDTSNVTDMSGMFSGCSLTSLDLRNFNTSQVTNMSDMFGSPYFSTNINEINVSSFDTSKVTNMSNMFHWCSNLTSLDLSSFDTSKVTNMSGMFESCSSLTSIDLSSFNTSSVTDMNDMFCECPAWDTVDQTKFKIATCLR
jgi:surface protein